MRLSLYNSVMALTMCVGAACLTGCGYHVAGAATHVPANVRTLALIEVLFAQAVSYYSFKQPLSLREAGGIVLIVIGVGLLVAV